MEPEPVGIRMQTSCLANSNTTGFEWMNGSWRGIGALVATSSSSQRVAYPFGVEFEKSTYCLYLSLSRFPKTLYGFPRMNGPQTGREQIGIPRSSVAVVVVSNFGPTQMHCI